MAVQSFAANFSIRGGCFVPWKSPPFFLFTASCTVWRDRAVSSPVGGHSSLLPFQASNCRSNLALCVSLLQSLLGLFWRVLDKHDLQCMLCGFDSVVQNFLMMHHIHEVWDITRMMSHTAISSIFSVTIFQQRPAVQNETENPPSK